MWFLSPFKKKKQYFIKTVTFYYIATYKGRNQGFYEFTNVKWIDNIPNWKNFVEAMPGIAHDVHAKNAPDIFINKSAIVDYSKW